MKIEKNIVIREVAGEYILIPIGEAALRSNGIFSVTEVGAFIWKGLSDGLTESEIIASLLEEYEVDEQVLRADYDAFSVMLREAGLVTE
ncbi:MAG: PqqD family protein [Eubacteriales bacterium]